MNKIINAAATLTLLYTEAVNLLPDMHLSGDAARLAFVEGYVDRADGVFQGEPEDFEDFQDSPESSEGHDSLDSLENEAERAAQYEESDQSDSGEPREPKDAVRMFPLSNRDDQQSVNIH